MYQLPADYEADIRAALSRENLVPAAAKILLDGVNYRYVKFARNVSTAHFGETYTRVVILT